MSDLEDLQKVTPLSPSASGEWLMRASVSSQPEPFHSCSGGKHSKYPPSPMDGDGWMDKISNDLNIYLAFKFKYCSKWFT